MKSIIKIHLCVLLLTIVSNGVAENTIANISRIIENAAKEKKKINDVFEPSEGGLICKTLLDICYKGLLTKNEVTTEVTMKFTIDRTISDNELGIYTHLRTIGGDTTFEVYGVPAIFDYRSWGDCGMMAMTLFDPGYQETFNGKMLTETDLLILFREILRIIEYLHGNNVFHRHIHLMHLMFRGRDSFIYDFSVATIYPEEHRYRQYAPRDDWRQLFHGMYLYFGKASCWNWLGFSENDVQQTRTLKSFLSKLKNDSESNEQFIGLRRVFVEFARYALTDNDTPITRSFYNEPARVIREEIERCKQQQQGKPVEPSWLTKDQDNVQASSSSSGRSDKRNRGKGSSGSSSRRRW